MKVKFLCIMLLVALSITTLGYPFKVYAESTEDYKTFSQGDARWGNHVPKGVTYTIANAGCFITSIAVLMAYANKDLRDVSVFNPQILSDKLSYSRGGLISTSCENADSTFKKVADDDSSSSFSEEDAKEKVVGYIKQGYYVTIMTSGSPITRSTHFSPVVGIDENGVPIVWDVNGGKHSSWEEWAKAGISQIDVFESSKSKSYDTLQGGSENNSSPSSEAIKTAELTAESDLVGMPDAGKLLENQIQLILPERSLLSISEQSNVEGLKENINTRNSIKNSTLGAKIISFIGLLLCVYAILLYVSAIFDLSNNWIDISLVELLTDSKCRVVSELDIEKDKNTVMSGKFTISQWTIRCVIVLSIGLFLISGLLQKSVYVILSKFL